MFENKRNLKQRIKELEKTCQDLELSIDFKNEVINDLLKTNKELNNIVDRLEKVRSAKSAKQNTSK